MISQPDGGRIVTRQADIAAFFGVSLRTVEGWKAEGAPIFPKRYDLAEISKWVVGKLVEAVGGGGSEALEVLRWERVEIARITRQQLEGSLVPAHMVRTHYAEVSSSFRDLGEFLGKQFGEGAQEALNERIREHREQAERVEEKAREKASKLGSQLTPVRSIKGNSTRSSR